MGVVAQEEDDMDDGGTDDFVWLPYSVAVKMSRNEMCIRDRVLAVEQDYQDTLKTCALITMENCKNYSWGGKKLGRLMRLVAPLM